MGEDGHTASLFPGSPVDVSEPTMPVTAHYQDRPANRVTLTPIVFNSARMIVFMATGEKKANTLAEVLRVTDIIQRIPCPADRPKRWQIDLVGG